MELINRTYGRRSIYATIVHWLNSVVLALALIIPTSAFAPDKGTETEYRLKAAFIYNFTQYIEWEPGGGDFVIGVLGECPILSPLNEIARLKNVKDKKIIVKRVDGPEDASGCQIMFVPSSFATPLSAILEKVSKGTLVIGERPGYGARGAAINFIIVDNKLRFESNLRAINAAGLKASSQLLKLAIIVG